MTPLIITCTVSIALLCGCEYFTQNRNSKSGYMSDPKLHRLPIHRLLNGVVRFLPCEIDAPNVDWNKSYFSLGNIDENKNVIKEPTGFMNSIRIFPTEGRNMSVSVFLSRTDRQAETIIAKGFHCSDEIKKFCQIFV